MAQKIAVSRIEVQNYRSCLKTVFEPNLSLSTLIGVNASGKSNLLNAILLLKKLNRPSRMRERDTFWASSCKIKVWFSIGSKTLQYQAVVRYNTDDHNRDDVIYAAEKWNFKDFNKKDTWIEFPLSLGSRAAEYPYVGPQITVRDLGRRLFAFSPKVSFQFEKSYPLLRSISEFAASINYYSASQFTDPSRCPPSFEIDDDGSLRRPFRQQYEHLQFLYNLYLGFKNSSKDYSEFISIVGKNGLNLIDTIKFTEVRVPSNVLEVKAGGKVLKKVRKTLLVIPNFIVRKTKLSPNQLSEGTFKTLAIVFYLITDKSKLLLLEEPEVCVHHGLLASIVELVKTFSARKQIIISTHSDFVLDMFDPTHVYVVQNLPGRGTIVKHVPKSLSSTNYKALKDYLNTSGNLGEYWRHGGLDR
jgi:ABC-type branched-subunit amino acid transport system ATPase component